MNECKAITLLAQKQKLIDDKRSEIRAYFANYNVRAAYEQVNHSNHKTC